MKNYRGRRRDYMLILASLAVALSAGGIVEVLDRQEQQKLAEPVPVVAVQPVRATAIQLKVEPLVEVLEAPEVAEAASYQQVTSKLIEPELVSLGEFKITHYCPCPKCCGEWADGITYTGTQATEGRTIAVDPSVIPLGSVVVIDGQEYIAEDIGGAIQGNRIDVYMDSHQAALEAGVKYSEIYILKEA